MKGPRSKNLRDFLNDPKWGEINKKIIVPLMLKIKRTWPEPSEEDIIKMIDELRQKVINKYHKVKSIAKS